MSDVSAYNAEHCANKLAATTISKTFWSFHILLTPFARKSIFPTVWPPLLSRLVGTARRLEARRRKAERMVTDVAAGVGVEVAAVVVEVVAETETIRATKMHEMANPGHWRSEFLSEGLRVGRQRVNDALSDGHEGMITKVWAV